MRTAEKATPTISKFSPCSGCRTRANEEETEDAAEDEAVEVSIGGPREVVEWLHYEPGLYGPIETGAVRAHFSLLSLMYIFEEHVMG